MALGILKKVSPEYVLGKAFLDIKKSGLERFGYSKSGNHV